MENVKRTRPRRPSDGSPPTDQLTLGYTPIKAETAPVDQLSFGFTPIKDY